MTLKKVKAGPVATGTDLRNSDLAIDSENSPTAHELQARRLQRVHRLSVTFAWAVAELVFAGCPR